MWIWAINRRWYVLAIDRIPSLDNNKWKNPQDYKIGNNKKNIPNIPPVNLPTLHRWEIVDNTLTQDFLKQRQFASIPVDVATICANYTQE